MVDFGSIGGRYNYNQYKNLKQNNQAANFKQVEALKQNTASYSDQITPTPVDLGTPEIVAEYIPATTTSSSSSIFSKAYEYSGLKTVVTAAQNLYSGSTVQKAVNTVSTGISTAASAVYKYSGAEYVVDKVSGLFKSSTPSVPVTTAPTANNNPFSTGTIVGAGTAAIVNNSSSGLGAAVGLVTGDALKGTVAGNTITTISAITSPVTAGITSIVKGVYDYVTGKNNQSLVQNVVNNVKSTVSTVAKTIASPITFTAKTLSSINSFSSGIKAVGTLIAAPFKTIGQGIGSVISAIGSIFTGGSSSSSSSSGSSSSGSSSNYTETPIGDTGLVLCRPNSSQGSGTDGIFPGEESGEDQGDSSDGFSSGMESNYDAYAAFMVAENLKKFKMA